MEPGGGEERIDALIERGLERYGRGDLLAALSEWEHVLMLVPDEPRAAEYIRYVRANFHLLEETFRQARKEAEVAAAAEEAVRALEEGVEVAGRSGPHEAAAPATLIGLDEISAGWTLDGEPPRSPADGVPAASPIASRPVAPDEGGLPEDVVAAAAKALAPDPATQQAGPVVEMEADEPPLPAAPAPSSPPERRDGEVEIEIAVVEMTAEPPEQPFEEATREHLAPAGMQRAPAPAIEDDTAAESEDEGTADEKTHARARYPSRSQRSGADEGSVLEDEQTHARVRRPAGIEPEDEERTVARHDRRSERTDGGSESTTTRRFGSPVTPPPDLAPGDADEPLTTERRAWGQGAGGQAAEPPTDTELRARIDLLLADAREAFGAGDLAAACLAAEAAEAQDPDDRVAPTPEQQELVQQIFRAVVGPLDQVPVMGVALADLAAHALDHRAGFLLSQIDGTLSFEELIAVAGMPEAEIFRTLARLLRRRVIAVV